MQNFIGKKPYCLLTSTPIIRNKIEFLNNLSDIPIPAVISAQKQSGPIPNHSV